MDDVAGDICTALRSGTHAARINAAFKHASHGLLRMLMAWLVYLLHYAARVPLPDSSRRYPVALTPRS